MKERAKRAGKRQASFEEALEGLERIVEQLESGDLPLERSLALFEEGVLLTRVCSERLDAAEKRIAVLMRDDTGEILVRDDDAAEFVRDADDAEDEAPPG